jgi:peptide/nickel transport system permease protein
MIEEVLTAATPGTRAETSAPRGIRRIASLKMCFGIGLCGFFVLMAVVGPLVAPFDPSATSLTQLQAPSAQHLLGTTNTGQDVLSQLLWGARLSLEVAAVAAAVGEGLAIAVGIAAGYAEGVLGDVLGAVINIALVIPVLPLAILVTSYLSGAGWLGIALVIGVTAWPWGARTIRSQTMSLRRRDYILAARLAGDPAWRILGFEILPGLTALVITGFLFRVLFAIIIQSGLAFLGVGSATAWSWGSMFYWAQNADAFSVAWWWYLPPGLCLGLLGLGLGLMNLGLDEVINPRLRGMKKRRVRTRG